MTHSLSIDVPLFSKRIFAAIKIEQPSPFINFQVGLPLQERGQLNDSMQVDKKGMTNVYRINSPQLFVLWFSGQDNNQKPL